MKTGFFSGPPHQADPDSPVPAENQQAPYKMEERLRTALDAAQIGLWTTDATGQGLLASPRARALLGFDADSELSLAAVYARILPMDRRGVLRTWLGMTRRRHDPAGPLKFRVRLQNGRIRWLESAMRPVIQTHGDDDQVSAIVGTATDISPRQHAEAELRNSGERFRQLIENLGDVFWIVDPRLQRQIYVSPASEHLWGYPPEALYAGSPHWNQLIHPEDRERVKAAFAAIETGLDFEEEYRMLRRDGSVCWVRDRAVAMRNADGVVERIIGVAEDINERRALHRDVRERERRLNLALDAARFHVWTFDVSAHHISIAEALCAALGLDPKRCSRPGGWRRRIHREDRDRVVQAFRACLAGGPDIDVEFRMLKQGSPAGWLALRATLITDEEAGAHLYGLCEDISARRADEERLRDSELQLRTLNDTIPVGIARCSLERRYLFVNQAYAQDLLAQPASEVPGQSIIDLIGIAAVDELEPYIQRVLAGESVKLSTTLIFAKVGQRTVDLSLVPDRAEDGSVRGWIEVINDVTESNRVERRLYQRDREFKTLVENAPDIIARLDTSLRYLYVNQAIEAALGMNPDVFVGRTGAELGLPIAMQTASATAASAAFSSGLEQPASFEVDSDSGPRNFVARLIPEFDRDGVVESVLMVVYDVTERSRAQRERDLLHAAERAARERAESAARARDQFLAIVSHELRSPLNGIQNWSSVLEGQMTADAPSIMWRALAGIKNGVDQQVRLIEDLLDATRIMSGNLSLTPQVVEIRPIVEAAIASVNTAAAAKQIVIERDMHLDHEQVRGDPDRIQQIIWNLLSNALKFTSLRGHVRVSLDRSGNSMRLRVTDDGKGIAEDFLPHMFEWFRSDETSSKRGQDGLGLGLALVRHLCELHGGTVSASSPGPGRGASFEVRLPLLLGSAETDMQKPDDTRRSLPSLTGLRVMVIDDQADAREALSALLSAMEAQVWAFDSGESAMQWLRQQDLKDCADVLLCDIAMPGEDGYDTLARIRAYERECGVASSDFLQAIALTAFAQTEERERALRAGFALHLAKPVSARDLSTAIISVAKP